MKPAVLALILSLILSAVEIYLAVKHLNVFLNLQYDDSFITFRYAEQLVAGNGFRFNPLDNSNSASAPTFGFLIAALLALKVGQVTLIANVVNSISLLAINFLFAYSGYKLFGKYWGVIAGSIVGALITSQGFFIYWTFSGMETTTYLLAFTFFLFIPVINTTSWEEWSRASKILFYSSMIIFATFRLEASLLAIFMTVLFVISEKSLRKSWKSWLPLITVPVVSALFFFVSWLLYYGRVLPEPVRFKKLARAYNLEIEQALKNLLQFAIDHKVLVVIAVLSAIWLLFRAIKDRKIIPAEIFAFAGVFGSTAFLIESPNSDSYRYNLILFPPTGFIILLAVYSFVTYFKFNSLKKASTVIAALLVLIVLFAAARESRTNLSGAINNNQWWWYIQEGRAEAGKWLEENTPPGSIVLSGDLGAISYYNPSNIYVDSGGLTNQQLVDAVESSGSYSDVIISRMPMYVVDTEQNGQTGSEGIFNNPQGFYLSKVTSSCKFNDVFEEKLLRRWPDGIAPAGLYVAIYELTPVKNAKC